MVKLPAILSFWRVEFKRTSIRRIISGLVALTLVVIFGVTGYVILGWSFADAFYQVVITISGVGLGEVQPINTTGLRNHTMMLIALGISAVAYTLGGFIQLLTEGEIEQALGHTRMRRQIEQLYDHVVIVGFGRVGSLVAHELAQANIPLVIIELTADRLREIDRLGYPYIHGDATEETTLQEARINVARAIVSAMPSDAENVFITLSARQMAPKVRIIVRAEMPTTQKKLIQAGADHVVMPAAIGAHRIATLLTKPSAVEFAELVTQQSTLAIEMDEFTVVRGGPLEGLTLRVANVGHLTGAMVIAIKRLNGSVQFPPPGDEPLVAGDIIVVLGRQEHLNEFRVNFRP